MHEALGQGKAKKSLPQLLIADGDNAIGGSYSEVARVARCLLGTYVHVNNLAQPPSQHQQASTATAGITTINAGIRQRRKKKHHPGLSSDSGSPLCASLAHGSYLDSSSGPKGPKRMQVLHSNPPICPPTTGTTSEESITKYSPPHPSGSRLFPVALSPTLQPAACFFPQTTRSDSYAIV